MDLNETEQLAIAGVLFGLLVYLLTRENQPWFTDTGLYGETGGDSGTSSVDVAQQSSDSYWVPDSSGFMTASLPSDGLFTRLVGGMKMSNVDVSLLNNPNIQAFLRVIRVGEGTNDAGGYTRLFGGGQFSDLSWHPNITVTAGRYTSTAAGAYQFLYSTWMETAKAMGLKDFSPRSQDIAALGRLAYRGAIDDILQGNFTAALQKTSKEWASLPFSPYGQPVISLAKAQNIFYQYGGTVSA